MLVATAFALAGCASAVPAASEPKPKPKVVARSKVAATVRGTASYYGRELHGRRTASGERFDMNKMTAAHRTLPFGTQLRVCNTGNERCVVVRVNDRGPFHGGRVLDLSRGAANRIGMVSSGTARIVGERLK